MRPNMSAANTLSDKDPVQFRAQMVIGKQKEKEGRRTTDDAGMIWA